MAKTITGIAVAIIEDEIIKAKYNFECYKNNNNWEAARNQNYAIQHLEAILNTILVKKQYKRKYKANG